MSHAPAPDAAPAACENCATPLQGDFCHHCGQSTHSPVRHVGHAVEEVFESFWHLDGRIFRTLRDLFVPGRIANRYLAGHRVRYVAPMRLFVILTLLTVFVAKFLINDAMFGLETGASERLDSGMQQQFAQADTVDEVAALRDDTLANLAESRRVTGAVPGVTPRLEAAEAAVQRQAQARIDVLAPSDGTATTAAPDTASDAEDLSPDRREPPTIGGPIGERIERNVERVQHDSGAFMRALLGVTPTTLFILVPLFAVLLKLTYLFRRRLYLEHVVIGLYSHAALMLALLLVFGCSLAGDWLAPHAAWAARPLLWLKGALLWAMPVYLLVMQKRVYGQSWPWTLLKFSVVGVLYFALFMTVAVPMATYAIYAL